MYVIDEKVSTNDSLKSFEPGTKVLLADLGGRFILKLVLKSTLGPKRVL